MAFKIPTEIRRLVDDAWDFSVFYRTRLSDGSTRQHFEESLTKAKKTCDDFVESYFGSEDMSVPNLLHIQRISENLDLMLRTLHKCDIEGHGPDAIDNYFRPITDANNLAQVASL